jgi:outer membrane protein assembly factor BamB
MSQQYSSPVVRRPTTIALTLLTAAVAARADDWPQWGGPERDLVWRETGIVRELPTGLLPRVWSTPIGEGYAGPAVADGRVFITDRVAGISQPDRERVLCLSAATGELLWKHEYDCTYTVGYPAGPRATPTCDEGRVYALGAVGHFFCFDAASGAVLWSKYFPTNYQLRLPTWGSAAPPLVDGDQLIALVGGPGALVVSFDKRTGEEKWRALNDREVGYCPPVIFEFGTSRQLIIYHPHAVSALDPQTGEVLWEQPFHAASGLSIPTPRRDGNRLLVTAFYNGSLLLDVAPDGNGAQVLWKGKSDSEIQTDGLHGLMCTPLFDGSHIYGVCSHGQLRCLDAATGERVWETIQPTGSGRWWNAFLIPHEDRVFIHNEQGELIIARLSPEGYEETSRALLVEPTREVRRRMTIWSHPAFAMKSVFARNDREIVRVSLAAP